MRNRITVLAVAIAIAGISGCASLSASIPLTAPAPAETTAVPLPGTALAALESTRPASLHDVTVQPSTGTLFGATSPDQRAYARYGHLVDVGIQVALHGVQSQLVVPMWYGKSAQFGFKGSSDTVPLVSAVADKSVVWWSSPGADVSFHFEDGYFVLDRMIVSAPHGGYR
jgi:hypothetical protein